MSLRHDDLEHADRATWARNELADQDAAAFIVELPGGDLPADQVIRHADTVATIAVELPML
ncbi:hypothetical protein [Ilumatobacter nonamiensis]|uniref:hypothetical protein n=1 Tax=Ilumatobacter nonamiensis TaxID=467093 RepID=UPI000344F012|nr:hypothetical protein [Ilumatobacter nonamiensis]